VATTVAAAGLTQQEAERKLAARPPAAAESSRSYKSIVVANVFTVFNLILLAAGVLTLSFGDVQDALFLAILVANAGIGIAQEVREAHARPARGARRPYRQRVTGREAAAGGRRSGGRGRHRPPRCR
jgi:magnesium-transporting ATPase (P-type)